MTNQMDRNRIKNLCESLAGLSSHQIELVERIVDQFSQPFILLSRLPDSNLVSECVLSDFGDILRIHHSFSKEPFTKDKFEYALEKTLNKCGSIAKLSPKGYPGHDITINNQRFSLKTQADNNIREDKLHISKFMELGKGEWTDKKHELVGLCNRFHEHMRAYDRILSLRCLQKHPRPWHYELVEIPKNLLQEAETGAFRIMINSKQFPKPGYCDVLNEKGEMKFQLYFDGGTERKLQIKNINKNYCILHARWMFDVLI